MPPNIPLTLENLSARLCGSSYYHLSRIIYPSPKYETFSLAKKSGGVRIINAPKRKIKEIQYELLKLIEEYYKDFKKPVHGFVQKRSVMTNAEQHLNKKFILNFDLEDFFSTIHFGRVKGVFTSKPFEFSEHVAAVIAHICCKDGMLPQGAPTSPIVSNLICRQLDNELMALAAKYRATYTRYCDDITFSFTVKRFKDLPRQIVDATSLPVSLGLELQSTILKNSFRINEKKTRLNGRSSRMEVTGITVNNQPNVKREYIHNIRGMLHSWEKYGLKNAGVEFANKYNRQLRDKSIPPYHNVVRGKLLYLKMIKGESSPLYSKLTNRFNSLIERDGLPSGAKLPISREVVNVYDVEKACFVIYCDFDFKFEEKNVAFNVFGTAFIYAEKYIVTCHHVISHLHTDGKRYQVSDEAITLVDYKNKKFEASIIFGCPDRDIAILKPSFDITDYPYFKSQTGMVATSQHLQIVGFPNHGYGKKISRINTEVTVTQYPKNGVQYIDVRDMIRQGNSGGPVVNNSFEIIGMAVEGATQADGDNGVIAISEIDTIIKSLFD